MKNVNMLFHLFYLNAEKFGNDDDLAISAEAVICTPLFPSRTPSFASRTPLLSRTPLE